MDEEKTPVREQQLDRAMGAVERFLLTTPKTRSEKPRDRAGRLFDIADQVRDILVAADQRPEGKGK